jgi:membrane protease YdiL (CAAX protease family)
MWHKTRSPIMLASALVLGGIFLVWSGLAWAGAHPFSLVGVIVVFLTGAGLCLAGGILGLGLFLRRLQDLRPVTPKRMPNPLATTAWIMGLVIILPVLVIPLPEVAQAWLDQKPVEFSAAAMVKSWPINGAPLQAILLLVLVYVFLWRRKLPSRTVGSQGSLRAHASAPAFLKKWVWPVIFSLLSGVGFWLVALFMQRITLALAPASWLTWFNSLSINLQPANGPAAWPAWVYFLNHWPVVLTMVLLAPLAEEAFFRGFVYPTWRERASRSGEIWGLLGSSALWAAYALNPLTFPSLVVAGLGLGLVARQTIPLGPLKGTPSPQGRAELRISRANLAPVWLAHVVMIFLLFFL